MRPPSPLRRYLLPLAVSTILGTTLLWAMNDPSAAESGLPASGASVQQLRAEVEAAQGARLQAEEALVDLLLQRIGLAAAAADLSALDRELVDETEETRSQARDLAVAAYVGGSPSPLHFLLDAPEAGDALYRQGLVADRAIDAKALEEAAAADLEMVRGLVLDLADRRGRVEHSLDVANDELARARDYEDEARQRLERAKRLAARPVVPKVSPVTGDPTPGSWSALRECESEGNYGAVSPSGRYRGGYQFDIATWLSVGGSGDPATAPPAEQDARAAILFQRRGSSPWPICGPLLD